VELFGTFWWMVSWNLAANSGLIIPNLGNVILLGMCRFQNLDRAS
jgi:hypothetical protein